MSEIELSESQMEILRKMIEQYRKTTGAVGDAEIKNISKTLDRQSGTLRNQINTLKKLGMVKDLSENVRVNKTAYQPTGSAYRKIQTQIELTVDQQTILRGLVENSIRSGGVVMDLEIQDISDNIEIAPEKIRNQINTFISMDLIEDLSDNDGVAYQPTKSAYRCVIDADELSSTSKTSDTTEIYDKDIESESLDCGLSLSNSKKSIEFCPYCGANISN